MLKEPVELTDGGRRIIEKMNDYASNPDDGVNALYELALRGVNANAPCALCAIANALANADFPFTEMMFEIQNIWSEQSIEFVDSVCANMVFTAFVDDEGNVTFAPDEDGERTPEVPVDADKRPFVVKYARSDESPLFHIVRRDDTLLTDR